MSANLEYFINGTITRHDEITYHYLTKQEKYNYLLKKYIPSLYLAYFPNSKEFFNNAFWRIGLDMFIESYIPGLDNSPFYKEVVYNVAGIPTTVTSYFFNIKVGTSNNTYSINHIMYSSARGLGKTLIVGGVAYLDPTKIETKDALVPASNTANYIVDSLLRWLPLSTEKQQSGVPVDLNSYKIYAIAVLGGLFRTIGSQIGCILGNNAGNYVKKGLFSPIAKFLALPPDTKIIQVNNDQKTIKITTLEKLNEASKKGPITLIETVLYELVSKIVINYIGAIIQQPSSRIVGTFAEETAEYVLPGELADFSSPRDEL